MTKILNAKGAEKCGFSPETFFPKTTLSSLPLRRLQVDQFFEKLPDACCHSEQSEASIFTS